MFEINKTWHRWTSRYNAIKHQLMLVSEIWNVRKQHKIWDEIWCVFLWFATKTFFILKTKTKPISTHVLISTIKSKIYKSKLVYILRQININSVVVGLDLILDPKFWTYLQFLDTFLFGMLEELPIVHLAHKKWLKWKIKQKIHNNKATVSKRICSVLFTLKNSNKKIICFTSHKTRHVKTTYLQFCWAMIRTSYFDFLLSI